MKEVIDGDEGTGTEDADIFAEMANKKHLPNFDFNGYPILVEEDDAMNSPRIKDEVWSNYQVQSQDDTGASQLRQNPQFQDTIIKALQVTSSDLQSSVKRSHLRTGLEILCTILQKGKVSDPNLDICKNSSLPTLTLNLLRNLVRSDILSEI